MLFRETHKIQTKPGAYGLLAGLLVMLLGLIANASCAHRPAPKDEPVQPTRTVVQRAESSVEVYTACGSGTGVLIDATTVLTAFHVVNCADWPASEVSPWIAVRTLDKKARVAKVEVGDGARDLARLKLTAPIEGVVPVRIRDAKVNDYVCAATAIPERAMRCGYVEEINGRREYGDVVARQMNVWYGNSGSGVYAADGTLVGIAVRLKFCTDGDALLVALIDVRVDTCGGRISSILDSPVKP